jgi:2'-5' RNA ligase
MNWITIYDTSKTVQENISFLLDDNLLTERKFRGDSWIIVAKPDQETAKKIEQFTKSLKLPNSKKADYYHITLRYWKGSHANKVKKIIDVLKEIDYKPITCNISKMEILGEEKSLVLRVTSPQLLSFQRSIDQKIRKVGVPPSDYDSFKAHITIAEGIDEIPDVKVPKFKVNLSKCIFNNGDQDILWKV